MARIKRKPPKPASIDQQTVETLRRHGYTVEREESIVAAVKPYSVRDQTPVERMYLKETIEQRQYDAAVKFARLWRQVKDTHGIRAQNYAGAVCGMEGEESERQAIDYIQAKAELTGTLDILSDNECLVMIAVVVFEESPRDWEHRHNMRHGAGAVLVKDCLRKIADLWRM